MKSFDFKGHTFSGVRQLNKRETASHDGGPQLVMQICTHQYPKVTSTPVLADRAAGWDRAEFYEAAERAGAGKMDLFRVAGQGDTLYLPAKNHLFIMPVAA